MCIASTVAPAAADCPALARKYVRQQRHIFDALAQRRHGDAHGADAMEQILAEATRFDVLIERDVGGRHEAHVDTLDAILADGPHLACLEHAQQLGLCLEAHLADLVEHERAAVGGANETAARAVGAGERPTHMSEQLRLDQLAGDGGAIDGDELAAAFAAVMDRLGDELLAHAALAFDQHRQIPARRLSDLRAHLVQRRSAQEAGTQAQLGGMGGHVIDDAQQRVADTQGAAHGGKRVASDLATVDPHTVATTEIAHPDPGTLGLELGVSSRRLVVVELQIGVVAAAQRHFFTHRQRPRERAFSFGEQRHHTGDLGQGDAPAARRRQILGAVIDRHDACKRSRHRATMKEMARPAWIFVLATATAGVYATGACVTSEAPVALEAGSGALIIDDLQRRFVFAWSGRSALEPAAVVSHPRALVELPATAAGATVVRDVRSQLAIRFWLAGAEDSVAEHSKGFTLYRGAYDGGALVMRPSGDGVEDFIALSGAPRAPIAYSIDVGEVAGLRLVGGTLEMLDAGGVPRLRVTRPWLIDDRGEVHDVALSLSDCAYDDDGMLPWGRPTTPPGRDRCTMTLTVPEGVAYPALLDPTWISAATMDQNRFGHAATVIDESPPGCGPGPVIAVSGGFRVDTGVARDSIEVYHPPTDTWCSAPPMVHARGNHTATYLDNPAIGPRLVVAGGISFLNNPLSILYNYESLPIDTWKWNAFAARTLVIGRADHTAAVVQHDGEPKVAIIGGYTAFGVTGLNQLLSAADGFVVAPVGQAEPRSSHTMIRLGLDSEDRFLLVGGCPVDQMGQDCVTTEIYCPTYMCGLGHQTIPNMIAAAGGRIDFSRAIVSGGLDDDYAPLSTSYIYNDQTDVWATAAPMPRGRYEHAVSVLDNGELLLSGGFSPSAAASSEAWRYNADDDAWRSAGELIVERASHTSTVVDGRVLVVGGTGDVGATSELYVPCVDASDCPDSDDIAYYCSSESEACAPKDPIGTPCTDPVTCMSGFCVEGVCCDSGCENTACESCTLATRAGSCLARPTAELPEECLPLPFCNQEGSALVMSDGSQFECDPYRCVLGACLNRCEASADCAGDLVCNADGACVPPPSDSGGVWLCGAADGRERGGRRWHMAALLLLSLLRSRRARRSRG